MQNRAKQSEQKSEPQEKQHQALVLELTPVDSNALLRAAQFLANERCLSRWKIFMIELNKAFAARSGSHFSDLRTALRPRRPGSTTGMARDVTSRLT